MITQPNSSIVPSIYHSLQTTIGNGHEARAIKLLDTVQILQPLDLTGLSESLAEVSSCLYRLSVKTDTSRQPLVLHLTSLASLLSSQASYASQVSLTRTSAVLATLLRTLTHLSRTYHNLLVLVDLDLQVQRRAPSKIPQIRQGNQGHELHSGFASSTGAMLQLQGSASKTIAQILERSCDTIVAVHRPEQMRHSHDGRDANEWVVEVVKDRMGANLGFWQPWKEESGTGSAR